MNAIRIEDTRNSDNGGFLDAVRELRRASPISKFSQATEFQVANNSSLTSTVDVYALVLV